MKAWKTPRSESALTVDRPPESVNGIREMWRYLIRNNVRRDTQPESMKGGRSFDRFSSPERCIDQFHVSRKGTRTSSSWTFRMAALQPYGLERMCLKVANEEHKSQQQSDCDKADHKADHKCPFGQRLSVRYRHKHRNGEV